MVTSSGPAGARSFSARSYPEIGYSRAENRSGGDRLPLDSGPAVPVVPVVVSTGLLITLELFALALLKHHQFDGCRRHPEQRPGVGKRNDRPFEPSFAHVLMVDGGGERRVARERRKPELSSSGWRRRGRGQVGQGQVIGVT